MARYTDAKCKLCRREGRKLFLKGDKCSSPKCSVEKRSYAPGMHGKGSRKKISGYGLQLREKQRVKRMYGVLERQFRIYFKKADKKRGATGENLLQFLERRLDNVVLKLGFAKSSSHARQLVGHGHFLVNDRKVNIPSFIVGEKDVVKLRERSQSIEELKSRLEEKDERELPGWLSLDKVNFCGTVERVPKREDITAPIEEHLIVELYSK